MHSIHKYRVVLCPVQFPLSYVLCPISFVHFSKVVQRGPKLSTLDLVGPQWITKCFILHCLKTKAELIQNMSCLGYK